MDKQPDEQGLNALSQIADALSTIAAVATGNEDALKRFMGPITDAKEVVRKYNETVKIKAANDKYAETWETEHNKLTSRQQAVEEAEEGVAARKAQNEAKELELADRQKALDAALVKAEDTQIELDAERADLAKKREKLQEKLDEASAKLEEAEALKKDYKDKLEQLSKV